MKKEDIHLIEAYLMQQLSEAERSAVEQRAAEDTDFADEIALQRDILNGIKWHEEQAVKQQIARIDDALAQSGFFAQSPTTASAEKNKFNRINWKWAVVLGTFLTVFSLLWYFAPDKPNNAPSPPPPDPAPSQPIAQNSPKTEPKNLEKIQEAAPKKSNKTLKLSPLWVAPDYANYRSDNRPSPTGDQAATAFQQKKYAEVLRIVAKVPKSDPNYWFFQEMSGHAAYLSGQFSEATRYFENIAASGKLPFSERAEWHLLLCYLTDYQQHKSAFEQLKQKITNDTGHPYYEQAKAL